MSDLTAPDGDASTARAELDGARRRVRRTRVLVLVATTVVVLALGLALALHGPARLVARADPSPALEVLGVVLAVVGLAAAVVGGVRAYRAGALRFVWNSPTVVLRRPARKRLLGRIRAGDAVPQGDQPLAVALAEQLARQRAIAPAYAGLMVYYVGQALLTSSPTARWLFAAGLPLFAVGLALMVRDSRRARAWLDRHGTDGLAG